MNFKEPLSVMERLGISLLMPNILVVLHIMFDQDNDSVTSWKYFIGPYFRFELYLLGLFLIFCLFVIIDILVEEYQRPKPITDPKYLLPAPKEKIQEPAIQTPVVTKKEPTPEADRLWKELELRSIKRRHGIDYQKHVDSEAAVEKSAEEIRKEAIESIIGR